MYTGALNNFSETSSPLFRVVLVEPEIPQNTGNIGRTCVATNTELHLIEPLSFSLEDKFLKRAGLDYWPYLKYFIHPNYRDWKTSWPDQSINPNRVFYFTTKSNRPFYDVSFKKGDTFVFGRETKGLSPEVIFGAGDQALTIPQIGPVRSLNLATAVAIVLYEGIRQINYLKH